MVQWTENNWNNRFVNPPSLIWLVKIPEAIHLSLLGPTVGGQADKILDHCTFHHLAFHLTKGKALQQ